jgi:hypothetical protein
MRRYMMEGDQRRRGEDEGSYTMKNGIDERGGGGGEGDHRLTLSASSSALACRFRLGGGGGGRGQVGDLRSHEKQKCGVRSIHIPI